MRNKLCLDLLRFSRYPESGGDPMELYETLRALRRRSGLTQEEVAEQVGLTRQAISSYESGRTQPDLDMLARLAEVYRTDVNGILSGSGETPPAPAPQPVDREQEKQLRGVRRTVWLFGSLTGALLLARAALLFLMNRFFAVEPGTAGAPSIFSQLVSSRFTLLRWSEGLGALALLFALAGCLVLLARLPALPRPVPLRKALLAWLVYALWAAVPSLIFAALDPLYALPDYLWAPVPAVVLPLLLVAWQALARLKRK